ncbi:MAG: hypothetical protein ABSF76_07005 [Opitutaceae bacterium]|jgi:hypothetical protein
MAFIDRMLRLLSGLLFVTALVALVLLLCSDFTHQFEPRVYHQKTGASALVFVGASFICLQLSGTSGWKAKLKGVLLGLAFVLWGGEQFLPAGPCMTAVDSAVITVFVVDLGWVILGRLRRTEEAGAPGSSRRP